MNNLTLDHITVKATREAAEVMRVHTVRHIGEYSVGLHTHNMMSMLFILYDEDPSIDLIKRIQFHDFPERWTGDIPSPAKSAGNQFTIHLHQLESDIFTCYEHLKSGTLSDKESSWLIGLDLLELTLWAYDQYNLGNRNISPMLTTLYNNLIGHILPIPEKIREFIKSNFWFRLSDIPPKPER